MATVRGQYSFSMLILSLYQTVFSNSYRKIMQSRFLTRRWVAIFKISALVSPIFYALLTCQRRCLEHKGLTQISRNIPAVTGTIADFNRSFSRFLKGCTCSSQTPRQERVYIRLTSLHTFYSPLTPHCMSRSQAPHAIFTHQISNEPFSRIYCPYWIIGSSSSLTQLAQ